MVMLRKSSLMLNSCIQLHRLISNTEHTSKQIIYFTRFIRNSGYLVAGCCFSRQSDENSLLPKQNHELSDIQTVNNSRSRSDVLERLRNFFKMKRRCHSLEDISSQTKNVNFDLVEEICSKKQKTEDNKSDNDEEVDSVIAPVNKDLVDLTKSKIVNLEATKPESAEEKPKKYRPNYFVAIKISDAQIIKALQELQQHILDKDERLKKSMIQLATLHITLMVMHIGDTETHARALKTLQNIHQEHNDDMSKNPLKLEFKGLSNFQNRVLFAKLSADESYKRLSLLAESVKKHYSVASISSTDSKANFTPHLTVVKIRDVRKKKKELQRKIDPSLYKDFNDQYFGSQDVQSIQLLSMTDPKDEVGYYSGTEIYFSAFEPKVRREYLNKLLDTEEKKKNVKELINSLMKEKLK